jgi:hypothetical protein
VLEVVGQVLALAGGSWQRVLGAEEGALEPDVKVVFIAAACDCLAKWGHIDGLAWQQVKIYFSKE